MTNVTEKMEVAKINPSEFGIEESKANVILTAFEPLQERMAELEPEYLAVIAMPLTDVMAEIKAADLLKKYVKVRTGRNAIHKQEKDFFLNAGRFVDRIKNDANAETEKREAKLDAIKNHFINLEKERVNAIAVSRNELLKPYEFDGSALNLGSMDDNVWISFLSGTKLAYEAKKAEEKRMADEAAAKAIADKLEQERIAAENVKLKAEAEAKEKALELERAKAKKEADLKEALRLVEQKKADMLLEAQRKESEAKLKKEREAKEKVEAELKERQFADEKLAAANKAIAEAEAKARAKALNAPEKTKLVALSKTIRSIELPIVKTEDAKLIIQQVEGLIRKLCVFIDEKSETL